MKDKFRLVSSPKGKKTRFAIIDDKGNEVSNRTSSHKYRYAISISYNDGKIGAWVYSVKPVNTVKAALSKVGMSANEFDPAPYDYYTTLGREVQNKQYNAWIKKFVKNFNVIELED